MAYREATTNRLYQAPVGTGGGKVKKKRPPGGHAGFPDIDRSPFVNSSYTATPGAGQDLSKLPTLNTNSLVNAYNTIRTNSLASPGYGTGDPTMKVDPNLPGGSTGGGGGSGGGAGSDTNFKNRTGFARNYAPGGDKILYDNPEILVRDTLKSMGYDPDSGIMDLISQDADTLQYLMMLSSGTGQGLNGQSTEDYINFGNQWAKNQATPGGATADPMAMIQSILDAPGGSALAAALANGTPQEQAAMLNNLMQVAAGGLTPLMQKALSGRMEDRTTDWLSEQAKGGKTFLPDYLQQGGRGILG